MAKLIVMYRTPADPAAFDAHYFGTHVPIAKKIPGLRSYEVNDGGVGTPAGPSGFHLVAILTFDRMADIEAGMAKLLAARVAWSNADNALQIHGGNGYAMEYPVSRVLCDARILNIFEGAAEIQAQVVCRGLIEGRN